VNDELTVGDLALRDHLEHCVFEAFQSMDNPSRRLERIAVDTVLAQLSYFGLYQDGGE